jgi:hypothetical protein
VQLAGVRDAALGDRMAVGDDDVICRKVVLLDRKRHQGQKVSMETPRKR